MPGKELPITIAQNKLPSVYWYVTVKTQHIHFYYQNNLRFKLFPARWTL